MVRIDSVKISYIKVINNVDRITHANLITKFFAYVLSCHNKKLILDKFSKFSAI